MQTYNSYIGDIFIFLDKLSDTSLSTVYDFSNSRVPCLATYSPKIVLKTDFKDGMY